MNLPTSTYLPDSPTNDPWHHEQKWLDMDRRVWERLDEHRRMEIEQKIKTYARSTLAHRLFMKRQEAAKREISSDVQSAIKVVVTVSGAFTYGAGMRVITAGLGVLALPAGLVGGAIASFIVDRLAVEANTNRLKKEQVQQIQRAIKQQLQQAQRRENPRPGQILFYQAQWELLEEVEGDALQRSFPTKALWAIALSAIEYAVAIWIVQNIGVLAAIPLPIRLVVASLPVVLTHAAALVQAQAFEMPRYARELLPHYHNALEPHPDLPVAEVQRWYLSQDYSNGGLAAWIANQFDRHATEPEPPLARLAYEREFIERGIQQLDAQAKQAKKEREEKGDRAIAALPGQFQEPWVDKTGRTEMELARIQRELDRKREQWVKAKTKEIQEQVQREVERLQEDYDSSIASWRGALMQVETRYDTQYRRWQAQEQWRQEQEANRDGNGEDWNNDLMDNSMEDDVA